MMYGLFVGFCVTLMVAMMSVMGVIYAYERCEKAPLWLEKSNEKIYKIIEKVLTK